jgi:hypothetical protein
MQRNQMQASTIQNDGMHAAAFSYQAALGQE